MQKRSDDRHESLQLSKHFVVDAISNPWSILTTANQPGVLQDSEVLGHRRLREGQLIDNLTAHSSLFQRQHTKDANTSWMPDRLRQLCQFIIGFRALKTLKVSVRLRLDRRAADGIGLRVLVNSHSTINDTTPLACRQSLFC